MPRDPRGSFGRSRSNGVDPWLVGFGILLQNIGQIVADDSANQEREERERIARDQGGRRLLVEQGNDQQQQQQSQMSQIMGRIAASQSPDQLGGVEAQTQATLPDPNDPSNTQIMDIGGTPFAGTIDTDISGRSMATGVQTAIDERRGVLETQKLDEEQQGFLEAGREALARQAAGESLEDIIAFQPDLMENLSPDQRGAIKGAESRNVAAAGSAKAKAEQDAADAVVTREMARLGLVLREGQIAEVRARAELADASPMERAAALALSSATAAEFFTMPVVAKFALGQEVTAEDLLAADKANNDNAGRRAAIYSLVTDPRSPILAMIRELDPLDVNDKYSLAEMEAALPMAVEFYDKITAASQSELPPPPGEAAFTPEELRVLALFDAPDFVSTSLSLADQEILLGALNKKDGG